MDRSQSSEQDAGAKKAGPFDNLSRDDLVKKCRGLLGIAQKAKQAKDECQEENRILKEQLAQAETQKTADKDCLKAMQEVVDSLTEQKLRAAMRVDELDKAVAGLRRELEGAALLRDRLEKISVENEAFQRQINRLTDENEELLGDLSGMEEKLKDEGIKLASLQEEMDKASQSKIALEQELLKAKNDNALSGKEEKLVRKLKLYKNKVQEISAKILLLKSDRKILLKTVKEYSEQVPKWQKELLNASGVLFNRTQLLEKENSNFKEQCGQLLEELDGLKKRCAAVEHEKETLKPTLEQQEAREQLQQENRKLSVEIANLERKIAEYEVQIAQAHLKNEELLQKTNRLEPNTEQSLLQERQILELSDELAKLKNQQGEYESRLQEDKSEKSHLQQKIAAIESSSTLEALQRNIEILQRANQRLESQMGEIEQLVQLEMTEKQSLIDKIAELEANAERFRELEQVKLNLEKENEKLAKKVEVAKNSPALDQLQDALEAKAGQLLGVEQALLQEREENGNFQALLEDVQKRFDELQDRYQSQVEELQAKNSQLSSDTVEAVQKNLDHLQERFRSQAEDLELKEVQLSEVEQKLLHQIEKSGELESTNDALRAEISEYELKLQQSSCEQEQLQKKLHHSNATLETMQGSYNVLTLEFQQLQAAHNQLFQEHNDSCEELNAVRSKFELVKLENSELLSELKEINEILKERGGVISLQLSKISELEAQKTVLQLKLNELDAPDVQQLKIRAQELERSLVEKESELQALRDRDRSFDTQSDVMSTSTISRAEEFARMKEVDDSFEEKYNKLRSLAVKLKKKVAEQTLQLQKYEKERESMALGKNLQSLQAEYDKLLDQLEGERKNTERLEEEVKGLREQLEKQKLEIETLNQVRSEIDSNKKDKSSLESTIREYREQLQSLKREKEAFNLAKKEIDAENLKLKATLKNKEKQLNDELEAQKELKAEVERSRLAAKKANVLNLEMEAYEKSLAELNKKLEAKKVQVKDLEGTIETQEGTTKSLRSQIALLEQSLSAERTHSQELKKNVDVQQEKLRVSEHQRGEMNVELAQMKVEYERVKLEIEANRVELSDAVTDKERISGSLETEKSKLLKQVYALEGEIEELRSNMKEKYQEVEDVRTEFASYKIRAQSVLRQNQSKESGKERELEDEVQTLQKTLESTQNKMHHFSLQITELGKHCDELKDDKTRLQNRCKELHDLVEESRLQNESLLEDNRRSSLNHQEALKTQRLQNETLVNCYKKQLEELQEKHSKEIETLQSRVSKFVRDVPDSGDLRNNNQHHSTTGAIPRGQYISDEQKINLLLMEREDGEGSESTSSQNVIIPRRKISNSSQNNQRSRSNRDLIPLDELLNSSFDDASVFDATDDSLRTVSPTVELHQTKEKLSKQESRVRHLTALLAEAEQDLAKLTQLNELLKEEVRRQERSIEREKHVHNSEYLKNVIFKFLTTNSGDEKSHLVPVLNTILKLSPEETQKLNNVAKGTDAGGRGWTGILWN